MKKYASILVVLAIVLAGLGMSLKSSAQTNTVNLKGWAWSSTIGWLSLSSSNTGAGTGAAYSVKISTSTPGGPSTDVIGNFSGHAWSPYIGWVSFNRSETGNPPSDDIGSGSGAIAKVNMTTGAVTGWARAIIGTSTDTSSGSGGTSIAARIYAGIQADSLVRIFNGTGWTNSSVFGSGLLTGIAATSDGSKIVSVRFGGSGQGYYSTNNGVSWTSMGIPSTDWADVDISGDGKYIVAVGSYVIAVSNNYGASWTIPTSSAIPTYPWTAVDMSGDGKYIVVGDSYDGSTPGGRVYVSSDYGVTWQLKSSAMAEEITSVAISDNGQNIAVSNRYRIYTSTNGGGTWTARDPFSVSGATGQNWSAVASGNGKLFATAGMPGYYAGQIYVSSDWGQNWQKLSSSSVEYWQSIAVSPDGNSIVAGTWNDGVHVSLDGGSTWNEYFPGAGLWYDVAAYNATGSSGTSDLVDRTWDGWIKLSGTNHPTQVGLKGTETSTRGVSFNKESGTFSGFAWGDVNVGWLQFRSDGPGGNPDVECDPIGSCGGGNDGTPPIVTLTASPMIVNPNQSTLLIWTASNADDCDASGAWSGDKSSTGGSEMSAGLTANSSFTIMCSNEFGNTSRTVTVTVNTIPPPSACVQPQNSGQCPGYVDVPSRKIWDSLDLCSPTPTTCEFYCIDGYTLRAGQCVQASIEES